MPFTATILTLFPGAFPGPLGVSVIGTAHEKGFWRLETVDIRQFSTHKHRSVDDTPAGGGPGLVMRPDVVASALDAVESSSSAEMRARPRVLLTPRGAPLTQSRVREWAAGPGVVLVCGRFEGVDQRVVEARDLEEVAVGEVVLAGGEAAALLAVEACVRLLPGVLGAAESTAEESFEDDLLEYPHYTRPRAFEGREIPPVLLSGDHGAVAKWRAEQSEAVTRERRPDLWARRAARRNK